MPSAAIEHFYHFQPPCSSPIILVAPLPQSRACRGIAIVRPHRSAVNRPVRNGFGVLDMAHVGESGFCLAFNRDVVRVQRLGLGVSLFSIRESRTSISNGDG